MSDDKLVIHTFVREEPSKRLEREGYEWRPCTTGGGYWVKCAVSTEDRVPTECSRCGKHGDGISSLDIASLDDWHLCKECFIYCIKDREETVVRTAMATGDFGILDQRGAKRWIKNNMPAEAYDDIYNPKVVAEGQCVKTRE